MTSSNKARWFITVADEHPDFHIEDTSTMTYAKIFVQPGKTKVVGRFDKMADSGTVVKDDVKAD